MRESHLVPIVGGAVTLLALAAFIAHRRPIAPSVGAAANVHERAPGAESRSEKENRAPSGRGTATSVPANQGDPADFAPDTTDEAFATATSLLPLSDERRASLHGETLSTRLRELDRGIERAIANGAPPSPPPWFKQERDELANRYFAEQKSPSGTTSPELAEAARRYADLVDQRKTAGPSAAETDDLHDLAEDKQHLFQAVNTVPATEAQAEERKP